MAEEVHLRNLAVVKDKEKAYLFRQKQRGSRQVEFWIPKGQIGYKKKHAVHDGEFPCMDISIPEWLFEKKAEENEVQEL